MSRRRAQQQSRRGGGGGGPAFPKTGFAIRLRADTGITIATGVSAWADTLSGGGNSIVQGTGALQPAFTASNAAFSGQPTVDCDGVSKLLRGAFALTQPTMAFIVGKWNAAFAAQDGLIDGNANNGMFFGRTSATDILQYAGGAGVVISATTPQTPHVYGILYNGASAAAYQDGVLKNTGNAGAANAGGLTVGASGAGTSPGNVSIAEIILFNRVLTTLERTAVTRYMGSRYGIAVV